MEWRDDTTIASVQVGQPYDFAGRPDAARWYAVNTLPHREFRAKLQLENQGFRVFLPTGLKTIRHARKLTTVVAAFFPRYLFLELDLKQHPWRSVNGTFGVASLVMSGDMPHPVPRGLVETMIELTDRAGQMRFDDSLKVGAKIRLAAGPFADQLGIVDRLVGPDRVRVLLNMMGGPVPVQAPREFVVAAY
jgi:transcriptional antiterminator RfaH